MPKTALVNMSGAQVGEIELSDAVFGIEPNQHAMHMAVVNYLANQRQGTQSTLTSRKFPAAAKNPIARRAQAAQDRAPQERLITHTEASHLVPSPVPIASQ